MKRSVLAAAMIVMVEPSAHAEQRSQQQCVQYADQMNIRGTNRGGFLEWCVSGTVVEHLKGYLAPTRPVTPRPYRECDPYGCYFDKR
jgi:hypothetical protein